MFRFAPEDFFSTKAHLNAFHATSLVLTVHLPMKKIVSTVNWVLFMFPKNIAVKEIKENPFIMTRKQANHYSATVPVHNAKDRDRPTASHVIQKTRFYLMMVTVFIHVLKDIIKRKAWFKQSIRMFVVVVRVLARVVTMQMFVLIAMNPKDFNTKMVVACRVVPRGEHSFYI